MFVRRTTLVLILALAWCWGAWHDDLEAAGWMFDHEHHHASHHAHPHDHHATDQSGAHEHTPLYGDDHEPVWARIHAAVDALATPFFQILLTTLTLAGVWALVFNLRVADGQQSGRRKRRARSFDPIWHFVRRCAPDVAAPPALS